MSPIRRSGYHSKTVEIPLSELPPPPNARERLRDYLSRALDWASDADADTIKDLIRRAA